MAIDGMCARDISPHDIMGAIGGGFHRKFTQAKFIICQ